MSKKSLPQKLETKYIIGICKNDPELALFILTWLKNGFNATKAYMELHPNIDAHSSSVLGSRQLAKVSKTDIAALYGLDIHKYMFQLKEGIDAMKRDHFSGEMYEDHKTRLPYHTKLGIILGIEQGQTLNTIQVSGDKVLVIPSEGLREKYGIQVSSNSRGSSEGQDKV